MSIMSTEAPEPEPNIDLRVDLNKEVDAPLVITITAKGTKIVLEVEEDELEAGGVWVDAVYAFPEAVNTVMNQIFGHLAPEVEDIDAEEPDYREEFNG